jgi:hypothetical protein
LDLALAGLCHAPSQPAGRGPHQQRQTQAQERAEQTPGWLIISTSRALVTGSSVSL